MMLHMPKRFWIIIPARFHSTRLLGKVLLPIRGKPMLSHVIENAKAAGGHVAVATDHPLVAELAQSMGVEALMTDANHTCGSTRVYEACCQLGLSSEECVINLQGDIPFVNPLALSALAKHLLDHDFVTAKTLLTEEEHLNPHVVKVLTNAAGAALYFSRAPIPSGFTALMPHVGHHVGIYGYRVEALRRYCAWPVGPLEQAESLEQLRILEQGESIAVIEYPGAYTGGVDVAANL